MSVSEVNIDLIKPNNGLIAFASIVINDEILLTSIGVHKKLDGSGFRITYPTKQSEKRPLFHPIRKNVGLEIEEAIFNKLKEVMKNYDGYNRVEY